MKIIENYYQASITCPYHLSVGVLVLNSRNEVLCHHFPSIIIDGKTITNLYLLVRETLEPNETLEKALHRGLQEEAGAVADIKAYLGSIVSQFPRGGEIMEKTTVYFLCTLVDIDNSRRNTNDWESGSDVLFLPIDVLIDKMKLQGERYKRTDIDESIILERLKKYQKRHGK